MTDSSGQEKGRIVMNDNICIIDLLIREDEHTVGPEERARTH